MPSKKDIDDELEKLRKMTDEEKVDELEKTEEKSVENRGGNTAPSGLSKKSKGYSWKYSVAALLLGLAIVIFGPIWTKIIVVVAMLVIVIIFIAKGKATKIIKSLLSKEVSEKEDVEGGEKLLGPIQVNLVIVLLFLSFLVIIFLLALVISWFYFGLTRGLMISFSAASLIGVLLYLNKSVVTIKAIPNHIGIVTILGSKTALGKLILVKDGTYISVGGNGTGRGILDYIEMKIEQVDQDLPKLKVMTQENVPMELLPMITWIPNIWDILDFITAGQVENIKKLLDNMVAQAVTAWAYKKPIEEVLSLNAEQVKKILLDFSAFTGEEKTIAAIMGITIRAFNLKIASIDASALKAMTQLFVEQRQQLSEGKEMETEKYMALNICDESAKRGEPMTYKEAYKIVKYVKLDREVGVGVVPGLDEAFGKGTAGVVDAAMAAMFASAGILPKMTDGRPVDVSKEQERPLAKGMKQIMGKKKDQENKERRGGNNKSGKGKGGKNKETEEEKKETKEIEEEAGQRREDEESEE